MCTWPFATSEEQTEHEKKYCVFAREESKSDTEETKPDTDWFSNFRFTDFVIYSW